MTCLIASRCLSWRSCTSSCCCMYSSSSEGTFLQVPALVALPSFSSWQLYLPSLLLPLLEGIPLLSTRSSHCFQGDGFAWISYSCGRSGSASIVGGVFKGKRTFFIVILLQQHHHAHDDDGGGLRRRIIKYNNNTVINKRSRLSIILNIIKYSLLSNKEEAAGRNE